jgi:hypothetical protein
MPARVPSSLNRPTAATVDQLNDPARGDTRKFVGVNVSEPELHIIHPLRPQQVSTRVLRAPQRYAFGVEPEQECVEDGIVGR